MENTVVNNGTVVLNGISDKDLVKILEVKMKHERIVQFNPQQMQVVGTAQGTQLYNNVVLNWQSETGLFAVHQIISILLGKEQHAEKAA